MGAKRIHLRDVPTRLATGAYILHTGLEKWHGDEDRAKALHGPYSIFDMGDRPEKLLSLEAILSDMPRPLLGPARLKRRENNR